MESVGTSLQDAKPEPGLSSSTGRLVELMVLVKANSGGIRGDHRGESFYASSIDQTLLSRSSAVLVEVRQALPLCDSVPMGILHPCFPSIGAQWIVMTEITLRR